MNTKRKKRSIAQRLAFLGPVKVPKGVQIPWQARMGVRVNA